MNVRIRTPYSIDKNLGKAYNEEMALIPDGDAACFLDGDMMFTIPDYGHVINEYANLYPNAVLTCWTNRTHNLSVGQQHPTCSASFGIQTQAGGGVPRPWPATAKEIENVRRHLT